MDSRTSTTARFRYRSGGNTSGWLTADELQAAAHAGEFDKMAEIQMSGHPDWKTAGSIGLSFSIDEDEPEIEEEVVPETEDRLTRFGSIRELMAAFVREEIELNFEKPEEYVRTTLCAISSDHFEIIDDQGVERTFIPLHRIKSIIALDSGNHGRNYKENHFLRVTIE